MGEFSRHRQQGRQGLARGLQGARSDGYGFFQLSGSGSGNAQREPGLCDPHRGCLGSIWGCAVADDFLCVDGGPLVVAEHPVCVHLVEVPLVGVDHEVVIGVLRTWQPFQSGAASVKGGPDLASIAHTGVRLGLLGVELHTNAMG
ncbi:hypothetical protein QMK19_21935 [Streptomyces sp. H10-C2]|uniref:hypothetical protein n=1 Tax=unclassified Streptomyces TaxID=2593676 RepID=UPI0024B93F63|nr:MULTISPECIES: hypothetical protein [unclassified Streptomyces]MDJ0342395.1 hypothetical protein [Streptomyces sp. PH10-H1]MDJ0372250.1 hypothetical protein [Streptomyces sp. H10-C2]